jgi:hypothetical protein
VLRPPERAGPSGQDLHEQLTWHWEAQLRPRLAGLTDVEVHWHPVPDCWSVVDGRPEGCWPTPVPAPVTTIGWRLAHLGTTLADRASAHFGDRTWVTTVPSSAVDLLAFVDTAYDAWTTGVLGADEARLTRAHQGPPGTADQHYPFWSVLLHVNREVLHHGAEVALLRDLYAHQVHT